MDSPFRMLKEQWLHKIGSARQQKKEFTRDGEECMRFFCGPYSFLYGLKEGVPQSGDFLFTGDSTMPRPSVAMTVNKVAEAVQIFGPVLYHRNPTRKITARLVPMLPIDLFGDPNDPNVQMQYQQIEAQVQAQRSKDKSRAALLQWYQDLTPTSTDLKSESRQAIDEALIKGMGVLWPQLWTPPSSQMRIVASCYDTVDNLLIDGDMETRKDAKWVSRTCTKPVWEFESIYGIPHGTIKQGSDESFSTRDTLDESGSGAAETARRQGKTNDLITYYEIYSKMGMGALMSGADWPNEAKSLDRFGQYCYLVVCKQLPYPANIPPQIWQDEQAIGKAVQWPCPYWSDDYWPFAELVFHDIPGHVWPMNHFKPAMGELKFLNWAYSFLASRMKKSARDILVVAKSASEDMRRALLSGDDFELVGLEHSHGKTLKEIVEVLQFPEVNGDMFKVIEAVTHLFEQRTGLNELMYGETSHAYRSAAEADAKQSQLHIRPDDMHNKTEDWMTQVSRMEALAARWLLEPERDILPIGGPIYATFWGQFVTPADPAEVLHQIEYRIEAGSSKKPNKDKEQSDSNDAMQALFQPMFQVGMQNAGVNPAALNPVNALITMWADAHDLDPHPFLIPPPPPPPPPPPDQPKLNVSIDFASLDMELQKSIMVLAGIMSPDDEVTGPLASTKPGMDQASQQQELANKEQLHSQGIRHAEEKHKTNIKIAKQKAAQANKP